MSLTKSGGGLGNQLERFKEEFTTWNQVLDPSFDTRANEWFRKFDLVPVGRYLTSRDETPRTMVQIEHWLDDFFEPDEILMIEDLVQKDIDLIGSPIEIESSELGRKVIEALELAGIPWRFAPLFAPENPAWPWCQFNAESVPADDKTKLEIYYKNDEELTLFQYVQIRKDKRGNQTALWFSPQLAASRPMHQITRWYVNNSSTGKLEFDEVPATDLGKVMNFGEWSELIALPILFKKLFLLAEAGTAEVEDSATREAAYSHLKVDQIPKPVLYFEVDGKVSSTWDSDQEQSIYAYEQFPHVANQGWIFQDADAASLAKTFRLFYDGMKRAQYSLTEGFQRNFTSDWSGSWDRYTLSAALMVAREQKQIVNGAGFWCPQIFTGVQSAITTGKYNAVRQPGQKSEKEFEEMVEITNTGMGSTVTAAINTLAFGHLLAKHEFELAARVLELAHLMHVPAESWNALSNWGIILYMTNDLAGAEEKFDKIIEESGGPSHDEAYAYKAAIAQLRGDTEAAAKYQALSDKAGPYNSPIFEQTSIKTTSSDEFSFDFAIDDDPTSGSSLTKNSHSGIGATSDSPTPTSSNSGGQRANYCGECGSKFDSAEQNFCGECGSKRQ